MEDGRGGFVRCYRTTDNYLLLGLYQVCVCVCVCVSLQVGCTPHGVCQLVTLSSVCLSLLRHRSVHAGVRTLLVCGSVVLSRQRCADVITPSKMKVKLTSFAQLLEVSVVKLILPDV